MGELLIGLGALTLFGSAIWFWLTVAIFLVICFASDINKNGFYAFGTLIFLVFFYYFWGDVKPLLAILTFLNVTVYLGIGLLYSTIKTFFSGRKLGKEIQNLPTKEEVKNSPRVPTKFGGSIGYGGEYYGETKEAVKAQFVNELKGNVFRWWFMWPFSLINWLFTDLIKDTWNYLYSKLKRFYDFVLELGIKSV